MLLLFPSTRPSLDHPTEDDAQRRMAEDFLAAAPSGALTDPVRLVLPLGRRSDRHPRRDRERTVPSHRTVVVPPKRFGMTGGLGCVCVYVTGGRHKLG